MQAADPSLLDAAARLGAALAAGLLVGLERGWREREQPEGSRVAGLRTFALIGLLGGILGLQGSDGWPVAAGLAAVALLFVVSFTPSASASRSLSITTAVAALVTFGLGVLAAQGRIPLALGGAAVVALLLGFKDELHGGIRRIEPDELKALLQIGVLSVAIWPLLPDAAYGPYGAWNPFRLWLAVVLIAAISLAGHAAVRWRGEAQGLMLAGLLGGIASSTAATLSLARTARAAPASASTAAAAAIAACGAMFLRMAIVASALQPALAWPAGALLVWLAAASFAVAWLQVRRSEGRSGPGDTRLASPVFDLPTALGFGLLLAAVAVAVRAAQDLLGEAGLHAVAFLSGLFDVDAILISTLQAYADTHLPLAVAGRALALAVVANMLSKAAMAWTIGGRAMGLRVVRGYGVIAAAGLAAAALVA